MTSRQRKFKIKVVYFDTQRHAWLIRLKMFWSVAKLCREAWRLSSATFFPTRNHMEQNRARKALKNNSGKPLSALLRSTTDRRLRLEADCSIRELKFIRNALVSWQMQVNKPMSTVSRSELCSLWP
uniref:AlNc14C464G11798 protein n=1 Tax=Albugo laibachii Nc14 TaxID=890382 RepID=F0X060_9STRA|nr:AlNc14C464G11798 [Albugo laibachii Nc14]|eukprot:CCA27142.1 AlNc14C464G11798 [Albugo laibachii Nc14]